MANSNPTQLEKDIPNRKIKITRVFDARPEEVWRAWTESELLDQWWAPKPWRAETKSMDFRVGGHWLYAMIGPDNSKQYARIDYTKIDLHKGFETKDSFCDENGVKNDIAPSLRWKNEFTPSPTGTTVVVEIQFSTEVDLKKVMEMGFEAGFTAALGNLDQYLASQFKLRSELKTSNLPRVTTYLNFPGNTEEAFLFYKKVFGTEFGGKGIQRFGDFPAQDGQPPISDQVKKMVLHIELPTLGGHILMATDAPQEMGFDLKTGNNMNICLEPTSRAETKRLFDELSEGGLVTMPLTDMFFGAYFGMCTDKFGINWMFNYIAV